MIGADAVAILVAGAAALGGCGGYWLGWRMRGEQDDM